ncbi:ABATE domain-containing protein [Streptomyces sp. LX-29]|uniref:CGNR zinc finger domain-containing protein n=1 Tax=Streptomyces sp. LX-29 TaxID=2900152 RepID=UPI00240E8B09|nr:ABATE domain-containing protein [Streptomyces sp. LX-29]WFB05712.1 ABATE domain-containing protein [Streptomyces sp. LX-29]
MNPTRPEAPADGGPDPLLAFPFIGGRACLNFVATLGKRHTDRIERLPLPEALARWFDEAGLLPTPPEGLPVTDQELADARRLREAIFGLLTAAMRQRTPEAADLDTVNAAAARPDLVPQLVCAGEEPGRMSLRRRADHAVPAALSTIARDAMLLVGGPLMERVKECERPECSLLFLDDSQARRRRWCSMERCGNLAKIAGYRSRSARRG